jgi:hypothetical protein
MDGTHLQLIIWMKVILHNEVDDYKDETRTFWVKLMTRKINHMDETTFMDAINSINGIQPCG